MKKTVVLAVAMLLLAINPSNSFAQLKATSPYGPKLTEYYDSIHQKASIHDNDKPLIGVSLSNTMKNTCTKSIILAGGIPVILPVTMDVDIMDDILDNLDAVMFSGGEDIDPAWYNEDKSEKCGKPNSDRDEYELLLFRRALDRNLPILGVCRGLQLINVAMGGSLYQDLPSELPSEIKHGVYDNSLVPAHEIRIDEESVLSTILGKTELGVNSRHHQGIKKLAPGLKATAWSPDGVTEAIEAYPAQRIMGVQFHPELYTAAGDTVQLKIFKHFVSQASLYAQSKDLR